MAMTAKEKVDEPATSPSSPSVKFTALLVATRAKTHSSAQLTGPRCQPGRDQRVNESVVLVCTQVTAKVAKAAAIANCPRSFPRLLRPRFRE